MEPICEQIDATIETDLATVASPAYQITLGTIAWDEPGSRSVNDLDVVIVVGDDEEGPDGTAPQKGSSWTRPYWIFIYIIKPSIDTDDAGGVKWKTWRNRVWADVQKALMANRQRADSNGDKLARNTVIRPPATFIDEQGLPGLVVRADVQYRTRDTDPYTRA